MFGILIITAGIAAECITVKRLMERNKILQQECERLETIKAILNEIDKTLINH